MKHGDKTEWSKDSLVEALALARGEPQAPQRAEPSVSTAEARGLSIKVRRGRTSGTGEATYTSV